IRQCSLTLGKQQRGYILCLYKDGRRLDSGASRAKKPKVEPKKKEKCNPETQERRHQRCVAKIRESSGVRQKSGGGFHSQMELSRKAAKKDAQMGR
ncbi:hypothetical protein ACFL6I_24290, partial [candidate division KSB1 bacterium]